MAHKRFKRATYVGLDATNASQLQEFNGEKLKSTTCDVLDAINDAPTAVEYAVQQLSEFDGAFTPVTQRRHRKKRRAR